ncbi:MAG: YbjQ family protein [Gemmatimonadales bacterium]
MDSALRHRGQPIPHELTSTGFELPGCSVVQSLGLVRGIVVRSRSVVGNIGAGIQRLFGGNITLYTTMCEQARENAFDIMIAHAQGIGANGVIGIRYDATEIMAGVTEVLCYGTAVVAEETRTS